MQLCAAFRLHVRKIAPRVLGLRLSTTIGGHVWADGCVWTDGRWRVEDIAREVRLCVCEREHHTQRTPAARISVSIGARSTMPPPSPAQVCNLPTYDFAKDGYAYLQAHKRREHALMAATGLSVGRLTAEQSAFLQEHMDVWATNQFFLHQHLIPDFYNLEMRTVPLV